MQGAMGAIAYVRGLRVLRIEDLHCRLEHEAVTDLGQLSQVRLPALLERTVLTLRRTPSQHQPLHGRALSAEKLGDLDVTAPGAYMPAMWAS